MPDLKTQAFWLVLLALPVACVAWTVTHEEVFHEIRDYCADRSQQCRHLVQRKFFYLFTCEYCFSHYIAAFFLVITRFKLLMSDWRGYLLAWFALVFLSNFYMGLFARLRLDIKHERVEISRAEAAPLPGQESDEGPAKKNIPPDQTA